MSMVLPSCVGVDLIVFEGGFKELLKTIDGSFKYVSRKLQGCVVLVS